MYTSDWYVRRSPLLPLREPCVLRGTLQRLYSHQFLCHVPLQLGWSICLACLHCGTQAEVYVLLLPIPATVYTCIVGNAWQTVLWHRSCELYTCAFNMTIDGHIWGFTTIPLPLLPVIGLTLVGTVLTNELAIPHAGALGTAIICSPPAGKPATGNADATPPSRAGLLATANMDFAPTHHQSCVIPICCVRTSFYLFCFSFGLLQLIYLGGQPGHTCSFM